MNIKELIGLKKKYKRMYCNFCYDMKPLMKFGSDIAERFLKEVEHKSFSEKEQYPLMIKKLVEYLGGRVVTASLGDGILGEGGLIYVHGIRDFDIVVPEWTYMTTDRITIAAAIGHYLLHYEEGQGGRIFYRKSRGRMFYEAMWFAMGLLMPGKILKDSKMYLKKHDSKAYLYFRLKPKFIRLRSSLYTRYRV